NAKASYDFSSNDPFPYPRYTDDWFNSHGTRCAGEVSAKRDNGVCGVGVAYDSKVAGIRMLDQPYMTDLIEANSMGHEPNLIDIYSASWGPTDDGKTVDGPRNATMRAIVRGVNEGRHGLGNIYVWASGDGGEDDDCNCDGYAASMWTVSINSAINNGENAHYDESCSSTLASTFSNGAKDPHTGVATTDLYGKCTKTHSGTSAAAPEAAGVFALALEANPTLTWRDIQHLTVLTSKRNSLYDSKNRFHWKMNGVGLEFNHLFGYGVLDAGAMVALAKIWKTVPPRYHCEAGSYLKTSEFRTNNSLKIFIDTDSCAGTVTEVNYVEHVQAVITLNATRRGDVKLFMVSPSGTRSMILSRRPNDDDRHDGFTKWPFMTTHTWGENPRGRWSLEARIEGADPSKSDPKARGFLREWTLMVHGTRDPPYVDLPAHDSNSKLAIVKKAHETTQRGGKGAQAVEGRQSLGLCRVPGTGLRLCSCLLVSTTQIDLSKSPAALQPTSAPIPTTRPPGKLRQPAPRLAAAAQEHDRKLLFFAGGAILVIALVTSFATITIMRGVTRPSGARAYRVQKQPSRASDLRPVQRYNPYEGPLPLFDPSNNGKSIAAAKVAPTADDKARKVVTRKKSAKRVSSPKRRRTTAKKRHKVTRKPKKFISAKKTTAGPDEE
ncbi:hypothetical protein HPB47_025871, partial [Ixodes persulcatus]